MYCFGRYDLLELSVEVAASNKQIYDLAKNYLISHTILMNVAFSFVFFTFLFLFVETAI